MLRKNIDIPFWQTDWPAHYYDVEDVLLRKQLTEEHLKTHPDDADCLEKMRLWDLRFQVKNRKAADRFMEAWLMIKTDSNTEVSLLNRRRKEKELRRYADVLQLTSVTESVKDEWRDFAETLLLSCCDTRAYRSGIFGLIDLGDEITAMRIAKEIDTVTRIYPAKLNLEELYLPLHEVMVTSYQDLLQDGIHSWQQYQSTVKNSR